MRGVFVCLARWPAAGPVAQIEVTEQISDCRVRPEEILFL